MYCDNARTVNPCVADAIERTVLVNRIPESAACVRTEVVEDDWTTVAAYLRLNIDGGSVQTFWAAGTGVERVNQRPLLISLQIQWLWMRFCALGAELWL